MKMVAAAKLRRAQEAAEAARPYAFRMERMLSSLASSVSSVEGAPKLLVGSGKSERYLLIAFTADRGLCGGFNSSIVRHIRRRVRELKADDKSVQLMCVGRKAHDVLKREFGDDILELITGVGRKGVIYAEGKDVGDKISELCQQDAFDVCSIVFNKFKSAMTQIVTEQKIIPFTSEIMDDQDDQSQGVNASHIFEPEEDEILAELLPENLSVQIFQAMLESAASEHGARMAAMDSATRNAGDMIEGLTLTYNRTRQAFITKELIEIISGAEAL